MIKVRTSKQIKKEDAPNNMLWMDLYGYIRYLEFCLNTLQHIPLLKRTDEIRYQIRFIKKEIKYLNAWFNGELK